MVKKTLKQKIDEKLNPLIEKLIKDNELAKQSKQKYEDDTLTQLTDEISDMDDISDDQEPNMSNYYLKRVQFTKPKPKKDSLLEFMKVKVGKKRKKTPGIKKARVIIKKTIPKQILKQIFLLKQSNERIKMKDIGKSQQLFQLQNHVRSLNFNVSMLEQSNQNLLINVAKMTEQVATKRYLSDELNESIQQRQKLKQFFTQKVNQLQSMLTIQMISAKQLAQQVDDLVKMNKGLQQKLIPIDEIRQQHRKQLRQTRQQKQQLQSKISKLKDQHSDQKNKLISMEQLLLQRQGQIGFADRVISKQVKLIQSLNEDVNKLEKMVMEAQKARQSLSKLQKIIQTKTINLGEVFLTINQKQQNIYIGISIGTQHEVSYHTRKFIFFEKNRMKTFIKAFQDGLREFNRDKQQKIYARVNGTQVMWIFDQYKGTDFASPRMYNWYANKPQPTRCGVNLRVNQAIKLIDQLKML